MELTRADFEDFMRRVPVEVADQIGATDLASDPRTAIERKDTMALRVMAQFPETYRRWYEKSLELEQAAAVGKNLDQLRQEVVGLITERDITRDALVRYLDHVAPRHAHHAVG